MGANTEPLFLACGNPMWCITGTDISVVWQIHIESGFMQIMLKVHQLHSFPSEIFIINYNEAMQRSPMDSVQDSI
jgi:hypothetical protein